MNAPTIETFTPSGDALGTAIVTVLTRSGVCGYTETYSGETRDNAQLYSASECKSIVRRLRLFGCTVTVIRVDS